MPKLTPDQIRFIDRYLENSGVEYLDIRYEMTDHIATAIEQKEGNFYDEFQDYMVKNKGALLQSAKRFSKAATNRAVKILLKGFLKPRFYIDFLLLFMGAVLLSRYGFGDVVSMCLITSYYLLYALICCSYINMVIISNKKRWSGLTKMHFAVFLTAYIITMVVKPEERFENETLLFLYYSVLISFIIESIQSYLHLKKMYKLGFDNE